MSRFLRTAVFLFITMLITTSYAQEPIIDNTIMPFFEAMKTGNVQSIGKYLGEPLSNEVRVLLSDNKNYPNFLRQRYENASSEVTQVRKLPGGEIIVNLKIYFPVRATEFLRLRIVENSNGESKIVEQQ